MNVKLCLFTLVKILFLTFGVTVTQTDKLVSLNIVLGLTQLVERMTLAQIPENSQSLLINKKRLRPCFEDHRAIFSIYSVTAPMRKIISAIN